MFSSKTFLLCLVALFTSMVSCLPVAPSSATLHDLANSTTATTTSVSSLLPREEPDHEILERQRKLCRSSPTYCEERAGFEDNLADLVFCTHQPAHCRDIFGKGRCTPWGAGPWWCHPGAKPPKLNGDPDHDKTALFPVVTPTFTASHDKRDGIPSPPPPAAEVTVTATVTKEFMVPEQTAATTLSGSATPSATSTVDGDIGKSLHKRGGWWCLWLCD
ncbi:hypothetical protein KCU65_g2387, partial [Aureobasidium melanogenum]